jgi:hypothetical protein
MASTYSPNLRIELIGYGEQNNTWGTTTNTNLGTLIEQSIAGQAAINVTAGDVPLSVANGATDQARQMILGITGTPGTARNVIAPSVSKVYVVANGSNATVTVKTAAGTGVPVSAGKAKFVYCNGTDFYEATTEQASAAITNLTVSGNTILGDASADTVTINGTVQPGVVISGSSSSNALRITQTGSGNALVVEDDTNPDSSPFVVEATGDVLIGTATSIAGAFSDTGKLQVATNTGEATQHNYAFLSNPNGSIIYLNKSRSGTIGANTIVQNADILGQLVFAGADGSSYTRGAAIIAEVDGTPGTNDMPGRLVFSTTADGASSPTERMRIDNAGRVGINGTISTAALLSLRGTYPTDSVAACTVANIQGTIPSTVTGTYNGVFNFPSTAASTALTTFRGFSSALQTLGASSTISVMQGFYADSSLVSGTTNYGFYSNIATASGRYNFYAAGTADNFFQGPIKSNGTVAGGYFAHSAGTTAMMLGSYNVVKVTPNATATYTTTVAPAGAESSIIIVTSGTTSYTITFGTGFLTTGTLATGTVTAKTFVVNFVSDGTTMIETSRTVAM